MTDRSVRRVPGSKAATGAGQLGALADLADLVGGESDRSRKFLGGLIAGALVGAAVVGAAGAALLQRRQGIGPRDPD